MKVELIDLKDMTDSRELLESKPHNFLAVFTYILILIVGVAVAWSYYGKIDIYVTGNGLVRPTDDISIIKNSLSGKIDHVSIEDSKFVKTGDVLYTIESENLKATLNNFKIKLTETQEEISNLNKYRLSVEKSSNLFKASNSNEEKYYTLVEKYLADNNYSRKQIDEENTNKLQQKEGAVLTLEGIELSSKQKSDEINNLQKYKECITLMENLFTAQQLDYFTKYSNYELEYNNLVITRRDAELSYDRNLRLYKSGVIAEFEVNNLKVNLEQIEREIENFKSNELLQIDQSIENLKKELEEAEVNKKKAELAILTYSETNESSKLLMQSNKLQLLTSIDEQTKSYVDVEKELQNKIVELEIQKNDSIVISPIDGYVNLLQTVIVGEFIQSGQEVATIIPKSKDKLKIDLAVSNRDIANIKVGQTIKFKILALPYKEYGKVEGIVSKIGLDAKNDAVTNEKYFMIETLINNEPIRSYKGEVSDIMVGMLVEGQVITDTKRILFWMLEKINLRD